MGDGLMEAVLFYNEADSYLIHARANIDAWCAAVGMTHIMVDRAGTLKRTNHNVFGTIKEAVAAFPDHEWVFLSEHAKRTLDQYTHPKSDVIYCVGSDTDGFQGLDLSDHTAVRYATPFTEKMTKPPVWYAATVVPMVLGHRIEQLRHG